MKTKMSRLEKFWVLYDVGNSAFTLLMSTIIPIYYKNMASANGISASDSTAYLSYAISISTLIVAVLGPVLGAVADNKNRKKPLFTFFMMMGVLGCAALAIPRTIPCLWMSRRMSGWMRCPPRAMRGDTSEAACRLWRASV